jgi:hypothetical protein
MGQPAVLKLFNDEQDEDGRSHEHQKESFSNTVRVMEHLAKLQGQINQNVH